MNAILRVLPGGVMMRVFVIGGTGFIGYHAVRELLRRGHAVTILSRRAAQAGTLFGTAVKVVSGDLAQLDAGDWARLLSGMDAVVFAAGVDERVRPEGKAADFFYRANVVPTVAVLQGAEAAGVKRAVVVTSIFTWLHREHPELDLAGVHPYIASRVQQEAAALSACRSTIVSILQLPYVFGEVVSGQKPLWEPIVNYVRAPVVLMTTAGGANMIAVEHVAEAIAGAVERPQHSAIHAIGDENLTWHALLVRLCKLAGRHDQRVLEIPNPVFRDLTRMGGFLKNLFNIESGLDTGELVRLLTLNAWFDPGPSRQALGYGQGGLNRALQATVDACPEKPQARRWRQFWGWMASGDR